jgi:hypothetical protein
MFPNIILIQGYLGSVEFLNYNKNKKIGHRSWDVIEDRFDFYFLNLKSVFPRLKGFTELSFQYGENGLNLVSLMV